jgi:hypothetical protein
MKNLTLKIGFLWSNPASHMDLIFELCSKLANPKEKARFTGPGKVCAICSRFGDGGHGECIHPNRIVILRYLGFSPAYSPALRMWYISSRKQIRIFAEPTGWQQSHARFLANSLASLGLVDKGLPWLSVRLRRLQLFGSAYGKIALHSVSS